MKAAGQGRRCGKRRRADVLAQNSTDKTSKPRARAASALLEGEGEEREGRKKAGRRQADGGGGEEGQRGTSRTERWRGQRQVVGRLHRTS